MPTIKNGKIDMGKWEELECPDDPQSHIEICNAFRVCPCCPERRPISWLLCALGWKILGPYSAVLNCLVCRGYGQGWTCVSQIRPGIGRYVAEVEGSQMRVFMTAGDQYGIIVGLQARLGHNLLPVPHTPRIPAKRDIEAADKDDGTPENSILETEDSESSQDGPNTKRIKLESPKGGQPAKIELEILNGVQLDIRVRRITCGDGGHGEGIQVNIDAAEGMNVGIHEARNTDALSEQDESDNKDSETDDEDEVSEAE